jgi:hypothetical protein
MNIRRILFTAISGAICTLAANAATVGYLSNVAAAPTDFGYTLTLQKFDPVAVAALAGAPSGVTLTGVQILFRGTINSTNLTIRNTGTASIDFDAAVTSNLLFTSSNSANNADRFTFETLTLLDTGIGSALGSCSAGATPPPGTCAPITLAGGASNNYAPITINNTDAAFGLTTNTGLLGLNGVLKNPATIASYVLNGGGTFTLGGSTKSTLSLAGDGGNIQVTQATNGTFQAEVDYTYIINSGTPEPATMALLGGGLLAIGLLRKRIKS